MYYGVIFKVHYSVECCDISVLEINSLYDQSIYFLRRTTLYTCVQKTISSD